MQNQLETETEILNDFGLYSQLERELNLGLRYRPRPNFCFGFDTKKIYVPDFTDLRETERDQIKEKYETETERTIEHIIHETIHKVLDAQLNQETSLKLENIDKDKTETHYLISLDIETYYLLADYQDRKKEIEKRE